MGNGIVFFFVNAQNVVDSISSSDESSMKTNNYRGTQLETFRKSLDQKFEFTLYLSIIQVDFKESCL